MRITVPDDHGRRVYWKNPQTDKIEPVVIMGSAVMVVGWDVNMQGVPPSELFETEEMAAGPVPTEPQ